MERTAAAAACRERRRLDAHRNGGTALQWTRIVTRLGYRAAPHLARLVAFSRPFMPPVKASEIIASAIRRHLKERRPAYMQPAQLHQLAEIAILPGRKVDEEALLAHAGHQASLPEAHGNLSA